MVGMRSFSWTIGAMKEIGGGSLAAGKASDQAAPTRAVRRTGST